MSTGACATRSIGDGRSAGAVAETPLALDAIQILGGDGDVNEHPTGRLLRDAGLYEIGAGGGGIRSIPISRELFRETARVEDRERAPVRPVLKRRAKPTCLSVRAVRR